MLKVIKIDMAKSWNLSQNTTKSLINNNIKITNNLWKQICGKNLQILSLTK
jgi:predicted deacetylase